MLEQRIARLNLLLEFHFGMTPAGGPLYHWMHSRDRRLFYAQGRLDGISAKVQYEMVPQVDEIRWVLATWQAPPSLEAWNAQFAGQIAYPRGGYYGAVSTPYDTMLEAGVEPTERITVGLIAMRKAQLAMSDFELRNLWKERREQKRREEEQFFDDALTGSWMDCKPRVFGAGAECFQ